MHDLLSGLRPPLAEASATAHARFTWFLRMDPQIAHCYDDPAHIWRSERPKFAALREAGDRFGLHPHAWRWQADRGRWVVDHDDAEWVEHCMETAFATFTEATGEPCHLHRFGDRFASNATVAKAAALGARVDLTVEPGLRATRGVAPGESTTGTIPDYRAVPRRPYHPAPTDFRRPDPSAPPGAITMLPLSSGFPGRDEILARRIARHLLRPGAPHHRPLAMYRQWRSPAAYWDAVARHLDEPDTAYLAIAIRTDAPASATARQTRAILEYLPRHPVCARLGFTDPQGALSLLGVGDRPD